MHSWFKKGIDAYLDYKSYKSDKQLVIIESDDWGSTRTKNKTVREQLNKLSPEIISNPYIQYDSIATADDLEALFEVLDSVKDHKGNPACITANVCTANPDFEAIKANQFEEFCYKPFTDTLKEYSAQKDIFQIWKQGMHQDCFIPQLHGREHLHALQWLAELRAGNQNLLKAFELESWGIPYKALLTQKRKKLQAALDLYNIEGELSFQRQWIKESVLIFEKSFGYKAESFIAPSYIWHACLHQPLVDAGIKSIQGIKLQYQPKLKNTREYKRKPRYIGELDTNTGLLFTTRNAFFEPYIKQHKDWVDSCLSEIKLAFDKNQPAIIGSHRINFVGRLNETHRDKNLKQFKKLLQHIQKQYPEVEFIDSSTLVEIIKSK